MRFQRAIAIHSHEKNFLLNLVKQFSDGNIHQSNLVPLREEHQTEKSTPSPSVLIRSQQFYVAPLSAQQQEHPSMHAQLKKIGSTLHKHPSQNFMKCKRAQADANCD
jgi:hypothetical protein